MNTAHALGAALSGVLGLLVGLAHFRALRGGVRAHLAGGSGLSLVAAHAARFGLTAAFFVAIVRWGALDLLAAFAGFVLARTATLALARRAS